MQFFPTIPSGTFHRISRISPPNRHSNQMFTLLSTELIAHFVLKICNLVKIDSDYTQPK